MATFKATIHALAQSERPGADFNSRQLSLLYTVADTKDAKQRRMTALAAALSIPKPSISRICDKWVGLGFLVRNDVPTDHRLTENACTDKGDSVPTRLATGEYVLTAQEVALLGQGDNKAGAKKLDAFRDALKKKAGAPKFLPPHLDRTLNRLAPAAGDR